jgi:hypothetical protein
MTGCPQATFCREGSSTWETLAEAPISAPLQRVLTDHSPPLFISIHILYGEREITWDEDSMNASMYLRIAK